MTTREEVISAAKEVAFQRQKFMSLAMVNVAGMTLEDRVDLDAQYKVAFDHYLRLEKKYQAALSACSDLSA